jgi:hypothetical protein
MRETAYPHILPRLKCSPAAIFLHAWWYTERSTSLKPIFSLNCICCVHWYCFHVYTTLCCVNEVFYFCCGKSQLELRLIHPTGNQTIFQLIRTVVILLRFINERFKPLFASHHSLPATQNRSKHFSAYALLYLAATSSHLSADCRIIVSWVSSVTGCGRLRAGNWGIGI